MEQGFRLAFDMVADFLKIMAISMFIFVSLSYVNLYVFSYKMMMDAEIAGGFTNAKLLEYNNQMPGATSKVFIDESKTHPMVDTKAEMLGEPLKLALYYEVNIPFLKDRRKFTLRIERTGINQGHYGDGGYGAYGSVD